MARQWSTELSDWTIRSGVKRIITARGMKVPTWHMEGSRCAGRLTDPADTKSLQALQTEFAEQVKRQAAGQDVTANFCAQCLITLTKTEPDAEPVAKKTPVKRSRRNKRVAA